MDSRNRLYALAFVFLSPPLLKKKGHWWKIPNLVSMATIGSIQGKRMVDVPQTEIRGDNHETGFFLYLSLQCSDKDMGAVENARTQTCMESPGQPTHAQTT